MSDTLLFGSLSLVVVIIISGILSFLINKGNSFFKKILGANQNEKNSFSLGIGFILTLFSLVAISKVSLIIPKWLYLMLSILIFREGMQIMGIVKVSSVFSSIKNDQSKFKIAIFTGILGAFLSFPIIERVFIIMKSFMDTANLLGVGAFAIYAVGQIVFLMSMELLVSVVQNIYSNPKKVVILSGTLFIFIGFIMSYFGFSYDFPKG